MSITLLIDNAFESSLSDFLAVNSETIPMHELERLYALEINESAFIGATEVQRIK